MHTQAFEVWLQWDIITVAGCTRKLEVGVREGIIPILSYYQQYRLSDPWGGLGGIALLQLLPMDSDRVCAPRLELGELAATESDRIALQRWHS